MILEDFVMLGKTAPETDRHGRVTVCSAGWSPELRQLVRVYPLAVDKAPPDFSVSRVRLERNSKDTRHESWAIAGDRGLEVHGNINTRFEVSKILNDRASVLKSLPRVSSISEANSKRLSLAVVEPENGAKLKLEVNKGYKDFRGKVSSKAYKYIPRMMFHLGGGNHKLKILNQEVFKSLSTSNKTDFKYQSPKNPLLLIGNMFAYRNNWLVISAWENNSG